jgi:Fur family transcriptional regulator, ferric uptake regulator
VTTARAMRATRQRAAVSGLLDRSADFRSAQEIHEELRRVGEGIGLTTVYRTLQALADAGEVDVLRTDSGESVYRRCATDDHHHHLVCRQCGTAVEIAGPAVETWAQRVAAEHGYTDLSHTVEIFGLCRDCGAASQEDEAGRLGRTRAAQSPGSGLIPLSQNESSSAAAGH